MKRNKVTFFVLLMISPMSFVAAQNKDVYKDNYVAHDVAQKIDSIVESARNELHLPGISLVIMKGDKIILEKGYGFIDRENAIPASPFTIYPIGSISKQFTAAAIMKLVEDKKLNLDDPVARYLPEYTVVTKPTLLIRHLLQQTSGIPEWNDLPEMEAFYTTNVDSFTLTKIINTLGHQQQLYAPGSWWSYSNSNYSLLAAIIERVTGKTYEQYLKEKFFQPLQLRSTASCEPDERLRSATAAVGYLAVGNSFELYPLSVPRVHASVGFGGLCSNATDLVVWMHALVHGKAISAPSYKQMITASPVTAGFTPPYGFGLSILPFLNQPAIWHIGVAAGFSAVLLYLPKQDITIAMLSNSRHALIQQALKNVVRELLHLPAPVIRDHPLATTIMNHSIGNYDDGMFRFSILKNSGHLFISVPAFGDTVLLHYQGKNEFAIDEPGMIVRLRLQPANGITKRVDWEWGEIRAYGRRVQ